MPEKLRRSSKVKSVPWMKSVRCAVEMRRVQDRQVGRPRGDDGTDGQVCRSLGGPELSTVENTALCIRCVHEGQGARKAAWNFRRLVVEAAGIEPAANLMIPGL